MLCFFGASVTQQKNGYAKIFLEKNNLDGRIHGYGGMHLCDAGICCIDNVIRDKPTVCFIDFFSTSYTTCNNKTYIYIDTIIHKFSEIQCKLIFLFLHRQDNADSNRQHFYNFCKNYLKKYRIPFIELYSEIEYNDKLLRDVVHTTDYGSELYADYIYDKYVFLQGNNLLLIPKDTKYTKYCDIKKIAIDTEIQKFITLHGNCCIVGLEIIRDSYCGILNIKTQKRSFVVNTWDEWCYFERNSIIQLNENIKKITINVSQNKFDVSSCENKNIDFNNINKKMNLRSIFYVSGDLKLFLCE